MKKETSILRAGLKIAAAAFGLVILISFQNFSPRQPAQFVTPSLKQMKYQTNSVLSHHSRAALCNADGSAAKHLAKFEEIDGEPWPDPDDGSDKNNEKKSTSSDGGMPNMEQMQQYLKNQSSGGDDQSPQS